jgi:myo-inositol-1(or 4)-monophosphatase
VEEAGGKMTHFDGSTFTLDSREVLATNGVIHAEMEQLFEEMLAGRGLQAIPTPAEFAARRDSQRQGEI